MKNTKVITIEKGNNVGKTILHNLPKDAHNVTFDMAYNKRNRVITATIDYELRHKV